MMSGSASVKEGCNKETTTDPEKKNIYKKNIYNNLYKSLQEVLSDIVRICNLVVKTVSRENCSYL